MFAYIEGLSPHMCPLGWLSCWYLQQSAWCIWSITPFTKMVWWTFKLWTNKSPFGDVLVFVCKIYGLGLWDVTAWTWMALCLAPESMNTVEPSLSDLPDYPNLLPVTPTDAGQHFSMEIASHLPPYLIILVGDSSFVMWWESGITHATN